MKIRIGAAALGCMAAALLLRPAGQETAARAADPTPDFAVHADGTFAASDIPEFAPPADGLAAPDAAEAPKAPDAAKAAALPEVRSPHLVLDPGQYREWRVDAGRLWLVTEVEGAGRVLVEAKPAAGGGWEAARAAVFGEYVVQADAVPYAEWATKGYFQTGFIDVPERNELLARVRFSVATLAELPLAERVMANLVAAGLADRNDLVYPAAAPNDPEYAGSWTLAKLELEPVWERFGFSPEAALGRRPVIAVIDNGASASDLQLWTNLDEIPGNGVDDDANGFIDDISGYNFFRNSPDLSYVGGHGSEVSKIAASLSNNASGTASPASSAALMRVIYYEGSVGSAFTAASAMLYAVNNGADVVNCSFITTAMMAFYNVCKNAQQKGVVVVAAAGNNGYDLTSNFLYPVCLSPEFPNVIGVGASDSADKRATSNYSASLVHLFAPASVTSYSTPLVSSAVALLKALKPDASVAAISAALLAGADPVPALAGQCVSGGRLNVRGAVEALLGIDLSAGGTIPPPPPPPPPPAPAIRVTEIGEVSVDLAWEAGEPVDAFEIEVSEAGSAFAPLEPSAVFGGATSGSLVEGLLAETGYVFRIRALRGALSSTWAATDPIGTLKPCLILDPALHEWSFEQAEAGLGTDSGEGAVNLDTAVFPAGDGIGTTRSGLRFAGPHDGILIPDSVTLNEGAITAFTLSLWFKPEPGTEGMTSVLYEQGGYWRGLNLIMERGALVANGWNRPVRESDWTGTTLDGGLLPAGEWAHIVLVLEAGEAIAPAGLKLYVNGVLAGSGPASQLWAQKDDNGFGQVRKSTVYRGRQVRRLDPLQGSLDAVAIWHKAFTAEQVQAVALAAYE